jgi:hypothetical protein
MRQLRIGDPWVDAHQMRPEELAAEARVFAAQRAILRGSPRLPRAGRGWAASALVPMGRRLLGLVFRLSAPAPAHQRRGRGTVIGSSGTRVGILGRHSAVSPKRDA